MEDYRLEQSGQEVQNILNGAAMQTDLTAENERAELAEQTLQGNIDDEALARENADIELQGHIDDEETRAKAAEKQNADDIDAIEEKIPTQASSSNQLADKDYVEDLVSTSSATFRGTFNLVSDLHLTVDASYTNIAAALGNAIAGADNNDFAFVMIPTSVDTPNEIARIEKYKFNGSVWGFEYVLNNSGFTAAQWAAINSGITSALVTKLGALPSAADLAAALLAKQDKLTFDQAPMPSSTNPVTSGGVYTAIDDEKGARVNADAALQQAIEAILLLIPSAATALNQLADKAFVNSSIATATATFRGTFNLVSDLQLAVDATHTDIAAALLNAISGADNNDYVFVQIPTSIDTPTEIRVTERYKFNGTSWQYEYDLNNSGFTAAQWEAINSGITALLVTKLSNLPNATELAAMFAGKQNVLTFDNAPVSGSDNPVKSGGLYDLFAATDAKMPTGASANNKLVAEDRLAAYVGGIIGALDATFDLKSADGHVTLRMTQTDGVIASLQILTSDIASASALATLGGRVSTNETDIANLQAAYAGLTQSDVIVGTLPSSGQQQNIIYRQPDQDHTPPQFYSDYMWNGSTWVLMATYNNAIDPRPKKASQNLVTSGGVFDNMGALDVSELNATENPHTLAQYVDLSQALAAIPTDYQKGGMSIKFVQSSDNKYVQARCMAQNFTTNEADWAFMEGDIYIDNSEFIEAKTDANGGLLEARKTDGTKVEFRDLEVKGNFKNRHLDKELESKLDKTKNGVNNEETLSYFYSTDNPEYLGVVTDNEDKVLGARTRNNILKEEVVSAKHLILSNKGIAEFMKAQRNNYTGTSNILALNPKEKVLPVLRGYKFWNIQSGSIHPDYVPLSLLWFSDIHGNARNLARIKEFYDAFKDDIDDVLCTGDFLYMTYADDFSYWAANGGAGFLNVMGNHDINSIVPGELNIISPAVCYERFFAPYIQDWGVNYIVNKLYWYKDYTDAFSEENSGGIRLIALDLFHWKETPIINGIETQGTKYPDGTSFDTGQQETWFINTLADARANNMAVIVTLHNPYPNINRVECSFMTLDKTDDSGLRSDMLQDVQDFIDDGGMFITWLCGHTHQDWIGTINGYPDQALLDIGTASYTINYRYDTMVDGTKSMDRFNIFNIEPVKKYIRIFRIGMEYDRHGRHIGSLVYDYQNHQLVSNS